MRVSRDVLQSVSGGNAHLRLAERFHSGDVAVLGDIWRGICPAIRRRLERKYKGLLAADRVEELTLEALNRAWQRRAAFDATIGPLGPWLTCIANRLAANFCHSPQMQGHFIELGIDPNELAELPDPSAPDGVACNECDENSSAEKLCGLVQRGLEPASTRKTGF